MRNEILRVNYIQPSKHTAKRYIRYDSISGNILIKRIRDKRRIFLVIQKDKQTELVNRTIDLFG